MKNSCVASQHLHEVTDVDYVKFTLARELFNVSKLSFGIGTWYTMT